MARELSRWLRQLEPARFRHLLIGGGVAPRLGAGSHLCWIPRECVSRVGTRACRRHWRGLVTWQLRGCASSASRRAKGPLEQDLPPPGAWEPGPVAERLKSLEADIAQDQLQLERARENATRQEELRTLRDSVVTLEEKVANLAREVGFDPEVTTESIAWFVHLAAELMQARAQRAEIQNRMERLQDEMQDYLAQVGAVLSRYGLDGEVAPDVATVRSHFQALESRLQRLRDAEREHARRKDETSRLERQIAEAGESVEALYREGGPGAG